MNISLVVYFRSKLLFPFATLYDLQEYSFALNGGFNPMNATLEDSLL